MELTHISRDTNEAENSLVGIGLHLHCHSTRMEDPPDHQLAPILTRNLLAL